MLKAALAQGKPTMVIAITTAAITHPSAIHKPPKAIQSRLRRREMTDIATQRPTTDPAYSPALVDQPRRNKKQADQGTYQSWDAVKVGSARRVARSVLA